ncbi:deaminase [Psychrobacter sp. B38]|uniref:deaminase n=1 Tax=Psychrobacter sp. B38 TaxID=3143538 RepID=UPI00320ECD83
MITDNDRQHLRRCIELAADALEAGDKPFGSVLVDGEGQILYEDRNRVNTVDAMYHPEIAIAKWAAQNLSVAARANAVVYTSGEHCAMCAAAHAWAGLGRIVYISSAKQLSEWMREMNVESSSPVATLSIQEVAPNVSVLGPIAGLDEDVKALQQRSFQQA